MEKCVEWTKAWYSREEEYRTENKEYYLDCPTEPEESYDKEYDGYHDSSETFDTTSISEIIHK